MLPDLETLFVKKCNDHVGLKLLAAQWEFDKLLLAKALQNIQVNFSHYSRHDESHSKQILINIERMLGEKTECFTATDLWLLLEAAYSHDIGMVITQKQIYDLDTNEFKSYVEELTEDSEGELYEFAINWLSDNAQLPQGSKSYKFIYKYKQLIAEWYRRKHSQNSSRYIKNPVAEIGLNSPRNELLPKRLFNILGDVCESHGLPFEDVMKLPYTEAGLGVDDCHPRFIACLLRMGDLLDVDENRFCPIMMNISGNNLPDSSILHFEKHQSIKHLRIDSERIKIEVECATPAVYEIAYDWFRWVETEYHRQSQNWPKIVPSKEFGKLPSLSTPLVTVKKPYVILHEGEKPSFGINKNKTLNMFRSAGLYNEEFDFVREVLQNAVDATLIAMWQDSKKELSNISPYSSEFDRILSNYSIDSNFEKSNGKIKVSIQDQGVGISRTELDNVFNVGGGQIKTNKNKIISEMPQWLKPSGNFGIGLQSLFIVTDSFKIITKSKETHDCYEIEFFSKYNKGIEIKKINNDNVMYGTLVEFYIDEVKFPKSISYDDLYGKKDKYVKLFNDYDITDDSSDLGDYQLLKLIEGVSKFNNFSMIKVKNNYLYENTNTDCDLFANYFSKELNIYLGDIDFIDSLSGNISDYTFFKGQRFSGINRILPIVTGYVDYHGYNAIGFLSYNRDKILKSAIPNAIDN
ncbi:HD domain-containing protein, partial [Morganella morganii]|nr:ATP-binding protein [Morganella morganii]